MKLALILALDPGKRAGVVLAGPLGYNEASDQFKALVAGGSSTVPDRPILEMWTSGGRTKSVRVGAPVAPTSITDAPPVVADVATPAEQPLRPRRK